MKKAESKRAKMIRELVKTGDQELCDEELMHMLISEKLTANSNDDTHTTVGQRAADSVAHFAGSWTFIFSFLAVMILWIVLNIFLGSKAFDAYPFILLNLALSCIAAVQAPLIMMSQNRQEAKDRARAESDYRINLKSELIIDDLHIKLDEVLKNQAKLTAELEKLRAEQKPPAAAPADRRPNA